MRHLCLLLALTLFAALGASAGAAQDLPPEPPLSGAGADPQRELIELFGEVELGLRGIDDVLFDAAAGQLPERAPADAGIERLLQDVRARGEEVRSKIDRILELAREMNQQSKSQGGGSQPPPEAQGPSPLDQPGQGQPGGRERTPEAPSEQPGGQKPGQPEPQPGGEKPDPAASDGKTPQSPEEGDPDDPGRNEAGGPPPGADTLRTGADGRVHDWGHLPARAREVFRVQGGEDLPPYYRDWIDGYHRRMARVGIERR